MPHSNRRLVLGFSAVIVVAFGSILYGFSVYVTDASAGAEFSTTILSLGLTGAGVASAVIARPLGRFMDNHGVRSVIAAGSIMAGLGMMAFASSTQPWHVLASWWLLIGPATAAVYYEPSMVGIAAWVIPAKQPRAFGALTLIGGLAGAIFIPLTERLNSTFGWRPTVAGLGLAIIVTGLAAVAFAIPPGRGHQQAKPTGTSAKLRDLKNDRKFVLFTIALAIAFLTIQGLIAHRVNRFTDAGFPIATVAVLAGAASIISMPGRYYAPTLVGRFKATHLTAAVFALLSISIAIAIPGTSQGSLVGHFVIFGIAFGSITPLRAMVMTKWYSGDKYGQVSGTQTAVMLLVAAIGPTAVGASRDASGSYRPALIAMTIAVAMSAGMTLLAGYAEIKEPMRSTKSTTRLE